MGSLRSLRGHTNYLPRFEVPALTQGTSEEIGIFLKKVWQSKLLGVVRKHSLSLWEVREARTQFGDVEVSIKPTYEQQMAWLEELEEQGYVSISREYNTDGRAIVGRIEGLDIYSPKKRTGLERQVIETLAPHKYLKGSTLLKRFKANSQQIEDTVWGLCERGLIRLGTCYGTDEFEDANFFITDHGRDLMTTP